MIRNHFNNRHHRITTEDEKGEVLLPFISPTTICILGPTQSGKSVFTKRLIKSVKKMFTVPPDKIMYAYSEYQKMFDDMQNIPQLILYEGSPDKDRLEDESKK